MLIAIDNGNTNVKFALVGDQGAILHRWSIATDAKRTADEYAVWLDQLLRDGAAQGTDMAEMIRSPIPERFAAISLSRYELIRSVSHLYPRYEREQMQRVDTRY